MMDQLRAKLREVTAGFTVAQKVAMVVAFVAIVGGLWMFSRWASESDLAPLYTDLDSADAAAVTEELDAQGVTFELADRGRTVLVPRAQVFQLRLDLSSAGIAEGSSQGYSLLDDQGITSTQFQQRVAFQRALEGELARTIRAIDAVEAASVHLVIPRDDIFVGDDIQSTASVLVQTAETLDPNQVQAIVNLVAGSVEGLKPDSVTVADQTGLVLAAPGQDAFVRAGVDGSEGRTRAKETAIAAEIEKMLAAVVGRGNVLVTVSADISWDRSSTVSETHTPVLDVETGEQLRSAESVRTETYSGAASGATGPLGGEEDGNPTNQTDYSLSDIDRQFIEDVQVTETTSDGGTINRINVAVLLNEETTSASQLSEIEALVTSAAGVDASRGDTLAVSRLSFDSTIQDAIAADLEAVVASERQAASGGLIRTAVLGGVIALIVIIAAVQLWRGRRGREEVEELDLTTLTNSLTAGMSRAAAVKVPTVVPSATSGDGGGSPAVSPDEELRRLVDNQPDEVARLLRTWLADRRAAAR